MALSFDVDNETAPFCQNTTSLGYIAQAHYGARVGLPRIMSLLKEHRARASFFVPAVSMLLTPEAIEAVQAEGHEIGLHGWIHERCGDLAEGEESGTGGTQRRRPAQVHRPRAPGDAHAVVGCQRADRAHRAALGADVRHEFDGARADGGLFQLTLHPHVIGRRSRALILRELLAYIDSRPGVWFATHEEVARHTGSRLGITPAIESDIIRSGSSA
ncbi:polysaccharide deacetylase family protein [Streptomyces sp. NPDC055094]